MSIAVQAVLTVARRASLSTVTFRAYVTPHLTGKKSRRLACIFRDDISPAWGESSPSSSTRSSDTRSSGKFRMASMICNIKSKRCSMPDKINVVVRAIHVITLNSASFPGSETELNCCRRRLRFCEDEMCCASSGRLDANFLLGEKEYLQLFAVKRLNKKCYKYLRAWTTKLSAKGKVKNGSPPIHWPCTNIWDSCIIRSVVARNPFWAETSIMA